MVPLFLEHLIKKIITDRWKWKWTVLRRQPLLPPRGYMNLFVSRLA